MMVLEWLNLITIKVITEGLVNSIVINCPWCSHILLWHSRVNRARSHSSAAPRPKLTWCTLKAEQWAALPFCQRHKNKKQIANLHLWKELTNMKPSTCCVSVSLLPGDCRIADNLLSVPRPAVVYCAGLVWCGYTSIIENSRMVTKQLLFSSRRMWFPQEGHLCINTTGEQRKGKQKQWGKKKQFLSVQDAQGTLPKLQGAYSRERQDAVTARRKQWAREPPYHLLSPLTLPITPTVIAGFYQALLQQWLNSPSCISSERRGKTSKSQLR